MQEKPKCPTIQNDKWERKRYIEKCENDALKDVMKIRLHMWNTKCNCKKKKKNESNITCHLCRTEDTTQHIMVCQEGNNTYNLLDENEKDWKK